VIHLSGWSSGRYRDVRATRLSLSLTLNQALCERHRIGLDSTHARGEIMRVDQNPQAADPRLRTQAFSTAVTCASTLSRGDHVSIRLRAAAERLASSPGFRSAS